MASFDFQNGFVFDLKQLDEVAAALVKNFRDQKIWLFHGEPGAGKTTLIKSITKQLGGNPELVNSPTFAIMNEYPLADDQIYHFDLFRTKNLAELLDIGLDELLDSGNYCFIEWPEKLEQLMPENKLGLYLEHMPGEGRRIRVG